MYDKDFTAEDMAMVRRIACKLKTRLPRYVQLDELISDGYLGWLDARQRFDPDRGVEFRRFAAKRTRGAMIDGLRERRSFPAMQIEPDVLEASRPAGLSPEQNEPTTSHPDLKWVRSALRGLPRRSRLAVELHYLESMPMKDVGTVLHITESAISQLLARTIRLLEKRTQPERPDRSNRSGKTNPRLVPQTEPQHETPAHQ